MEKFFISFLIILCFSCNENKDWNFKGTHDGDFFGIPATGKKVDLYGTTLILMENGKIKQEQDFFDNLDFYTQLGLMD